MYTKIYDMVHDHTISNAPLQIKVRRLYFIFCKFYVADRAFEIEPFLCLRTYSHNTD